MEQMKAYKFRIYPNEAQKELIEKTFGCTRFVYNYYLEKILQDRCLTIAKVDKKS